MGVFRKMFKGQALKKGETRPFSPALNAAINMLLDNAQQQAQQIVAAEARSLGLPDGTGIDLQKRLWIAKGTKTDESADAGEGE